MRSSESANRPRIAISVRIRWRPGKRKIVAKAAIQKTISESRQRARLITRRAASGGARGAELTPRVRWPASFRGPAREQSLRTPNQHHDHDGVDGEGAEFGHVIFAGDVGDAENDRGEERPGNARGAADRHHDQKVDHELERKLRVEAENLGAERAAEARQARSHREGRG